LLACGALLGSLAVACGGQSPATGPSQPSSESTDVAAVGAARTGDGVAASAPAATAVAARADVQLAAGVVHERPSLAPTISVERQLDVRPFVERPASADTGAATVHIARR
jgi:hypothetical protein